MSDRAQRRRNDRAGKKVDAAMASRRRNTEKKQFHKGTWTIKAIDDDGFERLKAELECERPEQIITAAYDRMCALPDGPYHILVQGPTGWSFDKMWHSGRKDWMPEPVKVSGS